MSHDLSKPIVTVGEKGVSIASAVRMLPDDKVVAWEAASEHIRPAKDRSFILGRYVQGGLPANSNGHIFRTEQLVEAHRWVPHTPLNVLHQAGNIVGTNAASELLYPTEVVEESMTGAEPSQPFVEVLGVVWRQLFPKVFAELQGAHDKGLAWFSLEAIPETVTCHVCAVNLPFDGPVSSTYCEHMNSGQGMWCENPLFMGNALILPPARPGWSDADITSIAARADANAAVAEQVYNQIMDSTEIEASEAERLMQQLVAAVSDEVEPEVKVSFTGVAENLMDRLLADFGSDSAHEFHSVMIDVDSLVAKQVYDRSPVPSDQKEPHVTVVLVDGKADPELVFETVTEWASTLAPFDLSIGGSTTVWDNGDVRPFVADVESETLMQVREGLVQMLEARGLTPAGYGGSDYHPHLTIKYLNESDGDPVLLDESGVGYTVGSVRLSMADDTQHLYDLV